MLLSISAFSLSIVTSLPVLIIEGWYAFFDLCFLADLTVEALLIILCVPCQVQIQLCLGLPDAIATKPGSVPMLFPEYLSLLSLLVQFPLDL